MRFEPAGDLRVGAHQLDKNLSTITVRSADGFKSNLDVSQIIRIPRNDAPKVIARFGDMSAPGDAGPRADGRKLLQKCRTRIGHIEFLKNRSRRQDEACDAISAALKEYDVGAVDTLIDDIVPPDELMKTLTDRKLAEQARVVDAERQVTISEFSAKATVKAAEGQAQAKKINGDADATVLRTVGEAEAGKVKAVGSAEAEVVKVKIASMESGNYAMVQVAEALAMSGMKLVPDVVASGGTGTGGTLVDVLLANLIRDNGAARAGPSA